MKSGCLKSRPDPMGVCYSVQLPPDAAGDAQLQRERLITSLEAAIAVEDPYNGEVVVRMINQGFIAPGESEEIASWQI